MNWKSCEDICSPKLILTLDVFLPCTALGRLVCTERPMRTDAACYLPRNKC